MRIESLFPLAIALSGFAASPTEALLLQPSSRNNHHGILTASATPFRGSGSTSTSTALFFKNATKSNFDVDNSPNPLITQGTAATIATTTEEDSSNPPVEDETSEDDLDTNVDLNLDLDFAPFDDNCFPGRDENVRFECDPSVAFWRDFQNNANGQSVPSAQDNVQEMNKIAQMFVRSRASSYFGKHLGRTAYFAVNAVLGDAAYRFVSNRNKSNDKAGAFTQSAQRGPFPMGMSGDYASKLVLEALLCYKQDYFEWIAKGVYREPWDMASLNHRQSNPFNAITQTSRFVRESVGVLGRRSSGTEKDKQVKFFGSNNRSTNNKSGTTAAAAAGKAHKSKIYPEYYQTAFHFQGDGWMSSDSANVYETSTETLFLGRQDSMQRTSLPPLVALANAKFKGKSMSSSSRPMRVLEVACGTGRFMTFVRDNLPLDAEYTALDLSPFYLENASDHDAYWRKTRAEEEVKENKNTATTIAPATLVQAQAEALPFAENSFDAVVCMYLFHEIPRHIRAKVAAEMARVVSPGGTVVLTDSIQKGDRPALDQGLPNFEKMNEPFYVDFVNDDLGAHFEATGLVPETKIVRSTTKSLSFSMPGELPL